MKSIFRYPGGKSKVVQWILGHRPKGTISEYREPFVGGGGVFFDSPAFERKWINDLNAGLIEVYRALAERPADFIGKCKAIDPPRADDELTEPGPRGEARYPKRLKELFDKLCLNTECDQALRYFFVNRTVFGGRVNYDIPSRLYFSNPNGWNIVKTSRLERAAERLQDVRITCGDYEPLFTEPGENVWIYADPPYVVNGNFTPTSQLYQHGFGEADHRRFAEVVKMCPHKIAISYDDDKDGFVRSLFTEGDGFWIQEAAWLYSGSTNAEKDVGKELLILNYEPPGRASAVIYAPDCCSGNDPLNGEEQQMFAYAESEIECGKQEEASSFVRKGNGLRIIRDSGTPSKRLYRNPYRTFEAYCLNRWGLTKSQAYRLINSSEIVNHLKTSPIGDVFPSTETQARELARLRDEKGGINESLVSQVWETVISRSKSEDVPITAKLIREEVNTAIGYEPKSQPSMCQRFLDWWPTATEEERKRILEAVNEDVVSAKAS